MQAGPARVMRWTAEPGWRWSTSMAPTAGTSSCQKTHRLVILSGRLAIKLDKDGAETILGPGDVAFAPVRAWQQLSLSE